MIPMTDLVLVQFCCVEAHTGDEGNERADETDKRALKCHRDKLQVINQFY